ncbi:---NA--- [Paramuricea clavata]|uniref:---NA n=2 Tax=Paramuricea clavata TaxID=317549 RepID=A0A6S7GCN9_PARCT|nr:---NA--- [Paramuricea clavata]
MKTYGEHFNKLNKFWTKLPTAMCDETVVATNTTAYCWDGSKIVNNTASVQQGNMNQTNQNGQNDKTITLMISELKTVIESMKAAVAGTTDDHDDRDQIYSGSGGSGSASGEYPSVGEEEEDATSINKITDPVLLNQPTDENSVDISEVIVIKPSDPETREIGGGGASYLHACVLLLIASLLVQLM